MSPHMVMVGAPGSGKTTIGKALATRFDRLFIDTDVAVAKLAGRELPEVFITDGESGVRQLERQVVGDATSGPPAVIALGSGALLDPEIRAAVSGLPAVWLQVTAPNAIARLGLNGPRPVALGNVRAQFAAMMADREPLYRDVSLLAVETDHRTQEDVLAEVIAGLDQQGVTP